MRNYGPKPRTKADLRLDVQRFCCSATRPAFERKTLDDLVRMAGGDRKAAEHWHAWRMGQEW